ncbi:enoyl-CoA hydratase/isomerase family protein [Cupriavidus numazuensis]|uniref:Crotonyl-CoA hydratase n=1 Tax=Cupriavidus numazuensis TaxID=221992 RepID=A0ABM8TS18_9BURK|nr:enoyl-CoA hydratase-related protein [Cupriavidus numazuensis]CAG2159056.1 Crotonyl-CoA hydratase [Cupriavidus numazuensis]
MPLADLRADTTDAMPVLAWREGSLAHIRFNRPGARNAVDLAMARAFRVACEDLAVATDVRALILSGEGRAFLSGGDLQAMTSAIDSAAEIVDEMHSALAVLERLEFPKVAAVHGAVAGGAIGVMLAADLIVAAQDTRFNVAAALVGASPECGTTWRLPRAVGLRRALELALLCEPLSAPDAFAAGLINRVVAPAELMAEAEAIARRLAAGPPLALALTRRLLIDASERDLMAHLRAEAESFALCAASADFAEGVTAMLQKRQAHFG